MIFNVCNFCQYLCYGYHSPRPLMLRLLVAVEILSSNLTKTRHKLRCFSQLARQFIVCISNVQRIITTFILKYIYNIDLHLHRSRHRSVAVSPLVFCRKVFQRLAQRLTNFVQDCAKSVSSKFSGK